MEKFPNRNFKGIHKQVVKFKDDCEFGEVELTALMEAIQRVVRYGGEYENFILGLFAIWDGSASISDSAADIGVTPDQ